MHRAAIAQQQADGSFAPNGEGLPADMLATARVRSGASKHDPALRRRRHAHDPHRSRQRAAPKGGE